PIRFEATALLPRWNPLVGPRPEQAASPRPVEKPGSPAPLRGALRKVGLRRVDLLREALRQAVLPQVVLPAAPGNLLPHQRSFPGCCTPCRKKRVLPTCAGGDATCNRLF